MVARGILDDGHERALAAYATSYAVASGKVGVGSLHRMMVAASLVSEDARPVGWDDPERRERWERDMSARHRRWAAARSAFSFRPGRGCGRRSTGR